jgi:hypothetical protein
MRTAAIPFIIALSHSLQAQVLLQDAPAGALKTRLEMSLKGTMKLDRGTMTESVPLEAGSTHEYIDHRTLKALRLYTRAESNTTAGVERGTRRLGETHRLIVMDRGLEGLRPWSPAGAMTAEELSLVAEHFDTLSLAAMLPKSVVNLNDTWALTDDAVLGLCLFDGIMKHAITGKVTAIDANAVKFTLEGTAEGVERGARVKLVVNANGTYDIASKMIRSLTWEQADTREAGPVSPAMEAKAIVTVTRDLITEVPAAIHAKLPEKRELKLIYQHPEKAYVLNHDRHWHAVVQTETHLVLRRVVAGELIGQLTIAPWKKTDVGNNDDRVKMFLDATSKTPGWVAEKTLFSGAGTGNDTARHFVHVATGKLDNVAVQQSFHLLTAADGRQVIACCVCKPEQAKALGDADAALVQAITFPANK